MRERALMLIAQEFTKTVECRCIMCSNNSMKNVGFFAKGVTGCDGNCDLKDFTVEDVIAVAESALRFKDWDAKKNVSECPSCTPVEGGVPFCVETEKACDVENCPHNGDRSGDRSGDESEVKKERKVHKVKRIWQNVREDNTNKPGYIISITCPHCGKESLRCYCDEYSYCPHCGKPVVGDKSVMREPEGAAIPVDEDEWLEDGDI